MAAGGVLARAEPAFAGQQPGVPGRAASRRTALVAAVGVVVAVCVLTALLIVHGASRTQVVAPLGGLLALGLVALACYRFEWFVLGVLALRTAVDATRAGSGGNQLASVVRTTPGAVRSGPAASALGVLFVVMSVLWLLAQRRAASQPQRRAGAIRLTGAEAAFGVFVTACLLSSLGSVARAASFTETLRIVAAILMFVVLRRMIRTPAQLLRVLAACGVAVIVSVARGALQAISGHGQFVSDGISRVTGTFLHPNTFGFFLAMTMLMAIAAYPHVGRSASDPGAGTRLRLGLGAGLAVGAALLVLTYSRGSWLAFVGGLVVIGVVQSRRVLLGLLVGAVVVLAAVPTALDRITEVTSNADGQQGSLFWRLDYWTSVSQLNHANPVTGIGLTGTKLLEVQSKAPHNDFLRAYAETGALGLLAFLLIVLALVGVARSALRATRVPADPLRATRVPADPLRAVAVGFAAVLTAYVIDSLGDNLLSEIVVLWYFYAVAACAAAVPALVRARPDPAGAEPTSAAPAVTP